ncbi:hypothetical protein [Testudinibacter aquarius]|uniref:DUF805 domain-containing protein n=1 Tax=Testudinibacter aquarius TaxID=1524974 RepID=A0A4R3YBM7_9PAST|nr:hypothetical protein [Testudinibacter aquarius]KAE9529848.1 hypothetical protein A1D24_07975 [Testudinibacter aquarius]TCV89386.1 hypothetical protein EDC16_102263 [Testudinibacter aquarius]TNG93165.1 hypothetical protein FHQ21_02455 [Testudinibacter aquarius]
MNKFKQTWSFLFEFEGKISQKHYLIFLVLWLPILVTSWLVSMWLFDELAYWVAVNLKISTEKGTLLTLPCIFILFTLTPILHSHISRRYNAIDKNVWFKVYKTILYIHIGLIIIAGKFITSYYFYVLPSLAVFSFYFFALIPMIAIAFYKDAQ